MKKMTTSTLAIALTFTSTVALAANLNDTNPNNDRGQSIAIANCVENYLKQLANGQTGAANGNANDSKQSDSGVTNCDGFWN